MSRHPDISKNWVNYLRNSSRQFVCPICQVDVKPATIAGFKQHVQNSAENHPTQEKDIQDAFEKMRLTSSKPQPHSSSATDIDHLRRSRKRSGGAAALDLQDDQQNLESVNSNVRESSDNERGSKKICSPGNSPPPSTPRRGRGRQHAENTKDFDRGIKGLSSRQLWSPGNTGFDRSSQPGPQLSGQRQRQLARAKIARPELEEPDPDPGPEAEAEADDSYTEDPSVSQLIRQPETRPISQEQLVAEVKGIYAGLVMVESKCIEVDNAQSANKDSPQQLNNEQWQALIALHRTLLHEHHDFFLASQHPSASPALRRLASKYAMPARMWRHGIHSFLELLRHRLPLSLEHMLTFIYIAYSMMALLYETVPAFEDTWIECLGDLGRYRMAIEDDDIRDRETWTAVSRYWYSKASDKLPTTGRLYHHLAILARPNALQQTYYYTKSLCVPIPFLSARESVMTLFDPVLSSNPPRLELIDLDFVRILAIFFSGKEKRQLGPAIKEFLTLLDGHIARITKSWLEAGYYMGISITCSLLGFGNDSNVLKNAITPKRSDDLDIAGESVSPDVMPSETFYQSLSFAVQTLEIVIRRWGDMNILPFLHTQMVFIHHLSKFPAAMKYIEDKYPWKLMATMLNYLKQSCKFEPSMDSEAFPGAEKQDHYRPLPEDYAMRGLIYTEEYFPLKWFSGEAVEEDEKYFEQASMVDARKERILWIGRRIASLGKWLMWDGESAKFTVADEYDVDFTPRTPTTGAREIVGLGADSHSPDAPHQTN
ncbi:telomerase-binding est1a [Trichoderma arundinaceum]|uniref:Telomerase-binding est1a n=1 Tax=Trichoderma arundinaceum TaxID=490622 RepID=A0A395NUS7_TRIAR|nr:telomerase-binding est1a [Trichoderma arundinaceum]